jgi:CRP-like cAMP-binding protein
VRSASSPGDTSARIRSAFERSYRAGELVYDEGWEGDTLFVIQAGHVELIRQGAAGERVISRHGPGDFFGEMGVLLGRVRTSRAVAISDLRLLQIDAGTFESMCVEQPEIAIRVIQRLAARTIHLEQRLQAIGADDLLRPVVRVLVQRAERTSEGLRVQTKLRQLAEEAGVSPVEAHRALSQLLDQRLVRLVEETLWISDLDALSAALDP